MRMFFYLRWPLEVSPGREATCRAVFGTWGFFWTMHGRVTAPSCWLHSQGGVRRGVRASGSYQEGTGKSQSFGMWNYPRGHVCEFRRETGLILRRWQRASLSLLASLGSWFSSLYRSFSDSSTSFFSSLQINSRAFQYMVPGPLFTSVHTLFSP